MSRAEVYTLNDWTTLDLAEQDGDTSMAVAAIHNVSITLSMDRETLFTADSVKPLDKMHHSGVVPVEIEFARFTGDYVEQVLDGAGGQTATSWTDTSDPQLFDLDFTIPSRDGSQEASVTVTGIDFPELPILELSENEYAAWNLSGEGMDITNFDVSAPA